MPTIADYLKYANLQMAAEAFLKDPSTGEERYTGEALIRALKAGNNHASKFPPALAADFADHWVVVDQCANTTTGFSGTLFRCVNADPATGAKAGELVISFRKSKGSESFSFLQVTRHTGRHGRRDENEEIFSALSGQADFGRLRRNL